MPGLTYVYMPSIPGWVSPNRPEPEPKKEERPAGNARPKKTAEYWFKFCMGELEEEDYILDTWEPEPTPARTPGTAPEAEEDEEDDDEDIIVSWPMTPEEIDAWQNQPISDLPPYYGSTATSNKAQSAQADFAAEGLGGATSVACPPPLRTAHYHWPFPTRDTVSLNFVPTKTTTLNAPGISSPKPKITLRHHVTAITQPTGRQPKFRLPPSYFILLPKALRLLQSGGAPHRPTQRSERKIENHHRLTPLPKTSVSLW